MPTSYTAGILDGDITTFEEYAKQCMRAFGASMHMRDEPMDKEWEPQEPSDRNKKLAEQKKNEIDYYSSASKEDLELKEKIHILDKIERCANTLIQNIDKKNQLEGFKEQAQQWEPPTDEHIKYKEFMIKQLDKTIDFDCGYDLWLGWLEDDIEEYPDIDGKEVRKRLIKDATASMKRYEKQHKEELERVEERNKWAKEVLKTFK